MATLVENARRVSDALKSIKQSIINKGVTPTGKCETFADAIDSLPCAYYGSLASVSTTNTKIECGFIPNRIIAVLGSGTTTYFGTTVYDNGNSTGFRFATSTATATGPVDISTHSTGFYIKGSTTNANFNNKKVTIIATKI